MFGSLQCKPDALARVEADGCFPDAERSQKTDAGEPAPVKVVDREGDTVAVCNRPKFFQGRQRLLKTSCSGGSLQRSPERVVGPLTDEGNGSYRLRQHTFKLLRQALRYVVMKTRNQ